MGNIQVCSKKRELYKCCNEDNDSNESDYYTYSKGDLQKSIQLEEQTLNKDLEYESDSDDEEYTTFTKSVKNQNLYENQETIDSYSGTYKVLDHQTDDIYGNQSVVDSQQNDNSDDIYANQEMIDQQEEELYANHEVEDYLKDEKSNLSLYDKVDWSLIRNHLSNYKKSGNHSYSKESQTAIKNYNNFIIAEARRIEKK